MQIPKMNSDATTLDDAFDLIPFPPGVGVPDEAGCNEEGTVQ